MPLTSKVLKLFGFGSLLLVSGCADYMNNRDGITLGAGDAPQANIAIHTVKPFPRPAGDTHITVSGKKSTQAYMRYLEPCDPEIVNCKGNDSGPATTAK